MGSELGHDQTASSGTIMIASEIAYCTAVELRSLYRTGQLSPVEVVRTMLDCIDALNPLLNAYITVTADLAVLQAKKAEAAFRAEAHQPPLLGVPVSIKDLVPTKGIRTTRGSLLYQDWIPDFDPPSVERIYRSGAVLLGKTNTCEFGWKGDSGNRVLGPTYNPWMPELSAGGSSGGAAAAVAAGLGPLALGSDGGGSLRIPASFCGVFGFKPSFGLIPQFPLSGIDSLSAAGPMSRTVSDAALLLNVLAGPDARDRHSLNPTGIDYFAAATPEFAGRVALSMNFGGATVDARVAERVVAAAKLFEGFGCVVEEVGPIVDDPLPILDVMYATANAAAHHEDFEDVRESLDQGRIPLVQLGFRTSGVELAVANLRRSAFCESVREFMDGYDILLTPTLPVTAFTAGADRPNDRPPNEVSPLGWTPFTYPFNLTGQPAASIPCGLTDDGLPVGLQIIGKWRDDVAVLRAARAFEDAMPWRRLFPAVCAMT
jgi:aspartyl-tRNA(Asn)/glutamyl-tRNA(Gln) amidotransferase subunit A